MASARTTFFAIEVYAFAVMSNQYHLVVTMGVQLITPINAKKTIRFTGTNKLVSHRLAKKQDQMKNITDIKDRLLSTSVTNWRVTVSTAVLLILCSCSVAAFGYICFGLPSQPCYTNFFYLSLVWLAAEYIVIGYLYCYKNIPKFAREAIFLSILMANIWFLLFLAGLKECAV